MADNSTKDTRTEPLAVAMPEAARLSGLGVSTLYAEIAKGHLVVTKIGRRTVVRLTDLRIWLASKSNGLS